MSVLQSVVHQPTPAPPKGIVYGAAGVGKTTFVTFPKNHLLLDCENGAGTIPCQRTPYLETWPDIEQWLVALEKEAHPYTVVAVDTIDWLVRRLEEHVTGRQLHQTLNKAHGGYGNGKGVMRNYIYQILLPHFNRIVNRGVALVLLAHARRTAITDTDGVTVEKTTPDLPDEYLGTFIEWADFVCMAQVDTDGSRTLVTGSGPSGRALVKNRYNMPPLIDFTWPAFTKAVSDGLAAKFQPAAKEEK